MLVNNAVSMTPKPFAQLEPTDFEKTYASSVTHGISTNVNEALLEEADFGFGLGAPDAAPG